MKKLLLLAAAAMAFAIVPASADAGNGCATGPGEQNAGSTCTYVAASDTASYLTATPNSWSITVVRDNEVVVLASGETAPPSSGTIATIPGETVTVTMGPDCVPGDFVCGNVGTVIVGETA
jgi:hypothetical protein